MIFKVFQSGGSSYARFNCPGCQMAHVVPVAAAASPRVWAFNGDLERPTLSPSILTEGVGDMTDEQYDQIMNGHEPVPVPIQVRCHSFVKNGQIEFLSDCSHALSGQTVGLPEIREGDE
jgi:hypothetical protein